MHGRRETPQLAALDDSKSTAAPTWTRRLSPGNPGGAAIAQPGGRSLAPRNDQQQRRTSSAGYCSGCDREGSAQIGDAIAATDRELRRPEIRERWQYRARLKAGR